MQANDWVQDGIVEAKLLCAKSIVAPLDIMIPNEPKPVVQPFWRDEEGRIRVKPTDPEENWYYA